MRPLSFSALMEHALGEFEKSRSIFGIREEKFYKNVSENKITLFGTEIDSPIGPAAGPNSQLAQNIAAAYLAGSRFIELKTVQTMDGEELRNCVPRPCINAADECYNVEWSTELTVQQAFDEYVKAWFMVHVLGKEYGLGTGVLFNMSVGYSYDGIRSKKIDDYIEGLKDAASTPIWSECSDWLQANLGRFTAFRQADLDAIPAAVSTSITLSTLHGCPREEIEKIADYLLREKKINTYIKCNPTLLGYEEARRIMDDMGYDYVSFDDHHFKEDLQFTDAVGMLGRLKGTAESLGLAFGVKITNTFPVDIRRGELPGDEMYMSGRALFPLSINVAARISEAFGGTLPVSYSGGADSFNLEEIFKTGIRPVTMATTILKPGGYERMKQLAEIAEHCIDKEKNTIDGKELLKIAAQVAELQRHRKEYREADSRKTEIPLELFDCAQAPCSESGCPIRQQIPAYLEQVAKGDYKKAFEIIENDNVLPSVTGTICDHQCQNKCTRLDYEDPLRIRDAKKTSSRNAQMAFTGQIKPSAFKTDAKVLVIGAGPAGLAAAAYLRRNGIPVNVWEKSDRPMGIVSRVIPAFRISDAEIDLDVEMAAAYGINIKYGVKPDYDLAALKKEYDYIILATGAWKEGKGPIPTDGKKVIDALPFLEESRKTKLNLNLGKRVAVIGGGDVAMDCARAAVRNTGTEEAVIVYRRTRGFMPAQAEEIRLALEDGVKIRELLSPNSYKEGLLVCEKMTLGDYDASGRRSVVPTGELETLEFDNVISAVGAQADTSLFEKNGIDLGENGFAKVSAANETSIPGVYIAGDCKAGPKTVVKAMADAKQITLDILDKIDAAHDFKEYPIETCRAELVEKKGVLRAGGTSPEDAALDAGRCLSCGKVCEICTDVCPNRANITIDMKDVRGQQYQILHMDGMCNECGNCGVFCPAKGDPYKDKLTLFVTEEDFEDSTNKGFLPVGEDRFKVRLENQSIVDYTLGSGTIPDAMEQAIKIITADYPYLIPKE
jgi:putative selenate reductase